MLALFAVFVYATQSLAFLAVFVYANAIGCVKLETGLNG